MNGLIAQRPPKLAARIEDPNPDIRHIIIGTTTTTVDRRFLFGQKDPLTIKMRFSLALSLAASAPALAWSFVAPKTRTTSPTVLSMAEGEGEENVLNKFSR